MDQTHLTELRDRAEAARDAQEAHENGADQPGSRALYDAWKRATERMGYAIRPDVIVGILDALDALQRHYDAAGPDHNLLALLDGYQDDYVKTLAKLDATAAHARDLETIANEAGRDRLAAEAAAVDLTAQLAEANASTEAARVERDEVRAKLAAMTGERDAWTAHVIRAEAAEYHAVERLAEVERERDEAQTCLDSTTRMHRAAEDRIATLEAALPTRADYEAMWTLVNTVLESEIQTQTITPETLALARNAGSALNRLRREHARLSAATSQAQQTPAISESVPVAEAAADFDRLGAKVERDADGCNFGRRDVKLGHDTEPPAPAVPSPDVVRCESYVEIGEDGRYIVWERDTACEGRDSAEYDAWRKRARRVDFTVDIPIRAIAAEIRGAK